MNNATKKIPAILLNEQHSAQSSTEAAWHVIKRMNDEQMQMNMKLSDEHEELRLKQSQDGSTPSQHNYV